MTAAERAARDVVVAAHLHMVRPIAMGVARRLPPRFDLDDLTQAGMLALVEAAAKVQGMEAGHVRPYLQCRIRGAMLDSVKGGAYREAKHAALDAGRDAATAEADPETLAAQRERTEALASAQTLLTQRQQAVLRYRFQEGLTQRETGVRLGGCRQPTVMQLERRAFRRLARLLAHKPAA